MEGLITIANYAKLKSITPGWVYKLGKAGKVKITKIDGVHFVEIENKK